MESEGGAYLRVSKGGFEAAPDVGWRGPFGGDTAARLVFRTKGFRKIPRLSRVN